MAPTGPIMTPAPFGAGNFNTNWETITQYDDFIHEAADPVGWPIERVRGHIVIESQGNPNAVQENNQNGWSYGLMQVVPYGVGWEGWHQLVKEKAGLPANAPEQKVRQALANPRTNILVGVAILETFYVTCGNLDGASSSFFTGTCNWAGDGDPISKVTGAKYKAALDGLIAEQTGGAAEPVVPKLADALQLIFGGNPTPINFRFGEWGDGLYDYGPGHGYGLTSPNQHTGLDVGVAYNTPIHSLAAGEVLCVGNVGRPSDGGFLWGQGPGYFNDYGDFGVESPKLGVGNITIIQDNGYKITYGHSRQAWVDPGDRVIAGQQIGTSGGMYGAHTHIDVVTCRSDLTGIPDSCYWLWDPEIELPKAMGAIGPTGGSPPCARVPVPQPQEWEWSIPVTATKDGVPVLQRANLEACPVGPALVTGDTFEGVMLVLGQDMNWYWVSRRGGRVPVEGTAAPGGPQIPTA